LVQPSSRIGRCLKFWRPAFDPIAIRKLLLNVAATDQSGIDDFYQHPGDSGRLGRMLQHLPVTTEAKHILLDEHLPEPLVFLRIDIEGAEVEVLGATWLLRRARMFFRISILSKATLDLDCSTRSFARIGFRKRIPNHFTPKESRAFSKTIEGLDAQIK